MVFWKYKHLARDLQQGTVSDKEYTAYLILFLLGVGLTVISMFGGGQRVESGYNTYNSILSFVSLFVWCSVPYFINKRGDGKDFLKRLVCLDFPATIRTLVMFAPFTVIASFFHLASIAPGHTTQVLNEEAAKGSLLESAIVTLSMIYFFAITVKAFRIASGQEAYPQG